MQEAFSVGNEKKLEYIAFNDVWYDCYSAIFNTLISSKQGRESYLIYRNSYQYLFHQENTPQGRGFYSLIMETDVSEFEKKLLLNERVVQTSNEADIIATVVEAINQKKIVLADVDMFYWHPKFPLIYNKNHIYHTGFVYGYDFDKKNFSIFEEGDERVSFDNLVTSVKAAGGKIYLYDAGQMDEVLYNDRKTIVYAKEVIASIDEYLGSREKLWNVDEMNRDDLLYFMPIASTHLKSITYRAKANAFLFQKYIGKEEVVQEFKGLESRYEILKSKLMMACIRNRKEQIRLIKEEISGLMVKEKEIWEGWLKMTG